MMNRVGQNGFIVSTVNPTVTLTDFALQNSATNSLRNIRLESRIASCTTGQHSIQIGNMLTTPTLSIGDNYANISNKLYIGTQTSINTTPSDVLTVNGSCNLGAVTCTACTIAGNSALTTTYNPFFCAGKVSSNGVLAFSSGRIGYTSSTSGTGIYTITYNSSYPNNFFVINVTTWGPANAYAVVSSSDTTKAVIYTLNNAGSNVNSNFYFTVF